jgi:hypothetical protein
MGVLSCPYRGGFIPNLFVNKTLANVCNHPAFCGPVVLTKSDGTMPSCLDCQLWKDSPEAAAKLLEGMPKPDPQTWARPEPPAATKKASAAQAPAILPCIHRGADTGQRAPCLTGCKAQFKVFACEVHGQCTLNSPGKGVVGCCNADCEEREESPPAKALTGS